MTQLSNLSISATLEPVGSRLGNASIVFLFRLLFRQTSLSPLCSILDRLHEAAFDSTAATIGDCSCHQRRRFRSVVVGGVPCAQLLRMFRLHCVVMATAAASCAAALAALPDFCALVTDFLLACSSF
jgi:hypothetical protein